MKKINIIIILILLNIFLINAYPTIKPYVNDFANVLTPEEEGQLNAYLGLIEEQSTYEIVVLTVENTEGEDRILYANRVGEENGVGKADTDNGLIIMWSMDNEQGGAIAVGRGAESIFNDAKVARIGRDSRHFFDDEQYYDGFINIIDDIYQELNVTVNTHDITHPNDDEVNGIIVFIIVVIAIFLIILILSGGRLSDLIAIFLISDIISSMTRGGRSSGGSFSGGSFGGGSFGGGGGKF